MNGFDGRKHFVPRLTATPCGDKLVDDDGLGTETPHIANDFELSDAGAHVRELERENRLLRTRVAVLESRWGRTNPASSPESGADGQPEANTRALEVVSPVEFLAAEVDEADLAAPSVANAHIEGEEG